MIDRVIILDFLANLGWEANEVDNSDEGDYKNETSHRTV